MNDLLANLREAMGVQKRLVQEHRRLASELTALAKQAREATAKAQARFRSLPKTPVILIEKRCIPEMHPN